MIGTPHVDINDRKQVIHTTNNMFNDNIFTFRQQMLIVSTQSSFKGYRKTSEKSHVW